VAQPVHAASAVVVQGELVTADKEHSATKTQAEADMPVVQGELWEDDHDSVDDDEDDDDNDVTLPLCSPMDDSNKSNNNEDVVCYHGSSREHFEGYFHKAFQEYLQDCHKMGTHMAETDPAVIAQKAAFHQKHPQLFSGDTAEAFCTFLIAWSTHMFLLGIRHPHGYEVTEKGSAPVPGLAELEEATVAMSLAMRWRYRVIYLQEHYTSDERNWGLQLMKSYTALGKTGGTRGMVVVLEKHLPCACVRNVKRTLLLENEVRAGVCLGCYKYVEGTNLKQCSKCKEANYCGRDCQTKHWKVHKKTCRPFVPVAKKLSAKQCN